MLQSFRTGKNEEKELFAMLQNGLMTVTLEYCAA
jgi:hypothetical protein